MENLFHEKSNEELIKLYKQCKEFREYGRYSKNELRQIREEYSKDNEMIYDLLTEIADRWLEKFDFPEMEL